MRVHRGCSQGVDRMSKRNVFTWNAVISAFARFGILDEAERVFYLVPEPDQCLWNAVLSGFAQHERLEEDLEWFGKMHRENCVLNEFSFGSTLSACSGLKDIIMGEQMHALVSKLGHSADVYMGSALIDMYSKCGIVVCAQRAFDGMSSMNLVSWNSLLSCYEQNGPASTAIEVFIMMMDHGFEPDEVTLASVVSACATLAAIEERKQIHTCVIKSDQFSNDIVLGNALFDLYAKCSKISEARQVFDRLPYRRVVSTTSMVSGYAKAASFKVARVMFMRMMERNVVSWNALIAGYTMNSQNEEAFGLFLQLKREAIKPKHYTFCNLLNAWANLADLQLGQQAHTHFLKHGLTQRMHTQVDAVVWGSLLGACKVHQDIVLGEFMAERLLEIDTSNSVPYVLLPIIYAERKRWADVVSIRKLMQKRGVVKQPGCSVIKLLGQVHVFIVKDKKASPGQNLCCLRVAIETDEASQVCSRHGPSRDL